MAAGGDGEYTMEEVRQHRTEADCWMVYHGTVVKVPADFSDTHPAGPVYMDCAGGDCSNMFNDNGHPDAALAMLRSWKIGVLKKAAPVVAKPPAVPEYTLEQVHAHRMADDCWVIYKGDVIKLPADFSDTHPAGPVFMDCAGTDATTMFNDQGHSAESLAMLLKWKIGVVKTA